MTKHFIASLTQLEREIYKIFLVTISIFKILNFMILVILCKILVKAYKIWQILVDSVESEYCKHHAEIPQSYVDKRDTKQCTIN